MPTLYLAGNHIPFTSLAVGRDYGHLQIVYQDGNVFTETEVQGPTDVTNPFNGSWDFPAFGQSHYGDNFTPGTETDGTWNDHLYNRFSLSLRPEQTEQSVWELLRQVRSSLVNENNNIAYDFNQNSNSYAYTLLSVVGLVQSVNISDLYLDGNFIGYGGIDSFPGWGTNILLGAHTGDDDTGPTDTAISLTLAGTTGNDYIVTGIGDDIISGQIGRDRIYTGEGNDILNGGRDNDNLNGGIGNDTAVYFGNLSNYTVLDLGSDRYSVTDNVGSEGTDTLTSIEYLEFAGVSYQIADVVSTPTTDDNDTTATADVLSFSDQTMPGHVGGSDPDDYYRFITSGSGSFTVSLTGLSADLDLRILDNNGTPIDSSTGSGSSSETLTITYTDNQLYYVRVDPFGSVQSNYSLGLDVTEDVGGGNSLVRPNTIWSAANTQNFTDYSGNREASLDIQYIVIHSTEGTTAGGALSHFANADSQVSAHYTVDNDGTIYQSVDDNDIAYHAGTWSYNQRSIGIEHVGYANDANGWTNAEYTASARLSAWLSVEYGIAVDRSHFIAHSEISSDRSDPGQYFDWDYYLGLVRSFVSGTPANSAPNLGILAAASYAAGTILTGDQLFSVNDADGAGDIDHITLWDSNQSNGAVWRYNGSVISPGGVAEGGFQFNYANRSLLSYTVGTGENDFGFTAYDDAGANDYQTHAITGSGGGSHADLVLTDVRLDDTTIVQGEDTTIRYNVVETNGVDTDRTYTGFYISNTTNFSDATFLESDSVTVSANEIDGESERLDGLSSYAPGTYYLFAVADYESTTTESNEGNNRSDPIQITITITAPTQVPEVIVRAASVTEAGEAVFSLGLDNNPTNASVEVFYRIEGGTATEGVDFEIRLGQQSVVLTSDSTDITIRVNTMPDGLVEGDETINLIIDQVIGGTVAQSNHYLTILDDDTSNSAPRFWFDPVDATGVEGSSFTFQLSGDVNQLTGDPLMEAYLHGLTVDDVVSIDVQFRDQTDRSLVTHTFQEVNGSWTNITTGQAFYLNAANNPYIQMPLENYSLANATLDYQITVYTRDDLDVEGPETAFWEVRPYLTGTLQHFSGLTTLQEIIVTDNDEVLNQAPENLQINSAYSAHIGENSLGGTVVGTLSASDPNDSTESLVYTLLDDAGGRFRIFENQVLVVDGADLDYEDDTIVNHSHMINVQVADPNGATDVENFFISLGDTNDAPTGSVVVTGNQTQGQTLSADTGTLSDDDGLGTFHYQWLRDGLAITGATTSTYGLEQADVGAEISVRVNYTDGQGTDESLTSSVTEAIETNTINLTGTSGSDQLVGGNGNDFINGGDGTDTIIGGDGDDTLIGGTSQNDLRDVIYGGDGNDTIDGGYGNDELRGDAGDDIIDGGFGADLVIGGTGNDRLGAGALGDEIFGGDGDDFINGGWGHDRVNGGTGADQFFHIGIFDHGSDWIQDYNAADGDVLVFGITTATADDFQVNYAHTADALGERSGDDAVQEAFVIYRPSPTGQIMWALVDGAGQSEINIQIGGEVFDLLG